MIDQAISIIFGFYWNLLPKENRAVLSAVEVLRRNVTSGNENSERMLKEIIELLQADNSDASSKSELDEYLEQLASASKSNPKAWNLYHYRSESVSFIGRDDEMKFLEEFCNDNSPVLWTAVIAPGGSGKSRLALELCKKYQNSWHACFISGDEISNLIGLLDHPCSKDVLLVVDYLNGKSKSVSDLLVKWPENGRRLRVLLLEREKPKKYVTSASFGWYSDLSERERLLFKEGFLTLSAVSSSPDEIAASYAQTAHDIHLKQDQLKEIETALNRIDSNLKRPLFTICITDAVCRNESIENWDKNRLLTDICGHELRKIIDKIENKNDKEYV
ncbi:MAG: hypothetical protein HUJ54_13970, partial [Erysipelotrichaceae bacterium]|nr:hypothetical protein [Erysipelotrichaceae bacterium]